MGDSAGTLHIMDVPWSLRRNIAGEYQAVKQYLARETTRREYCKNRWDFREEEKRELERQAALKAGVSQSILCFSVDYFLFLLKFEKQKIARTTSRAHTRGDYVQA